MGISLAVGIPAFVFLAASLALRNTASRMVLAALVHSGVVGLVVAAFSHPFVNYPLILSKSSAGGISWWCYVLFYPYLLTTQLYVCFKRLKSEEPLYTEICDGLFVGGWPVRQGDLPGGNPAVVDCTIELPRNRVVAAELPYLCIPSWDTRSPSAEHIELAVRWAVKKRAQNYPILIHCAKGHGRSVAVMCALLVALGVAGDWREGEVLVKRHRPRIRLNAVQKKSLQEWEKKYHLRS